MPETAEEKAAREAEEAEHEAALAAQADEESDEDEQLGEGGKRALAAERQLRERAEKDAKQAKRDATDLKKRLDKLEADQLSETEKEKKRADTAEADLVKARGLVRQANLVQALTDENVAHPKAAARLLDGVEFDDDGAPTNLTDRLTAAKAAYGDDMFRPVGRKAADINPGGGGGGGDAPKLTAEEQRMAQAQGMVDEQYAYYRDNPNATVPWKPETAAKT